MSVQVGEALLPILQEIVPIISEVARVFSNAGDSVTPPRSRSSRSPRSRPRSAGSWGLVVAAIGAIIAVVILVWKNWDQIWNWIKDHPAYAIILSILAAADRLVYRDRRRTGNSFWDNWRTIWEWVKGAVSDASDWISGAADDIVSFIEGIPGGIRSALSDVWNIITSPFRYVWHEVENIAGSIRDVFDSVVRFAARRNAFARRWNSIQIELPEVDLGPLGSIGGGTVGLPDLPMLAKGGIVTRPTLAVLGESGREAVVPLPSSGLGGQTFNITVQVAAGTNPATVGAAIVDQIRGYRTRSVGRSWRAA